MEQGHWLWRAIDRRPERLLFLAIALNALIATLAPALGFATLPRDTIEGFLWGRSLELGYFKHPPLQAWILGLSERLAPDAHWLIYLYAQICVALTFYAVWRLARAMLGERQGLLASLLTIVGVHTYSLPMANFTPDTLSAPLWAFTGLFWWQAVGERKPAAWFWLALVVALSIYAKYVGLLLVGVLGLLTLLTPEGRDALRRKEPWLAVVLVVVLSLPHIVWLVQNDFVPFQHATSGRTARNMLEMAGFTASFAGFMAWQHTGLALMLLLLLLPCRKGRAPDLILERPADPAFARLALWVMVLGPLALALLAQILSGNEFRHGRAMCMFAFSGIAAVMVLGPRLELRRLEIVRVFGIVLLVLLPIGNALAPWAKVWTGGKLEPTVYPARAVAAQMSLIWQGHTGTPLRIVAGDRWHAGNVAMYAQTRPLILLDGSMRQSPWITPEMMQRDGVLVVWSGVEHPAMPPALQALGPFAAQGTFTLPWVPGYARTLTLNYALKNPEKR